MTWLIVIPRPSPLKNEIAHLHWFALRKIKKEWYLSLAHWGKGIPKATGFREVVITRYSIGSPDPDGIVYGAAACIVDNLRPHKIEKGIFKTGKKKGQPWRKEWLGLGLITDDSQGQARITYRQVKVKTRAEARTEIEISDGGQE